MKGVLMRLVGLSLMAVLILVGPSYSSVTVTGDWEIVALPSPIPDLLYIKVDDLPDDPRCVPQGYPSDQVVRYTYTMTWTLDGTSPAPSYWAIGLPANCITDDPWAVFCITFDPGQEYEYPAGNLPKCKENLDLLYIKVDDLPDDPPSGQTYTLSFYSYYLPIDDVHVGTWLVKGGQSCESETGLPVLSCGVLVAVELSSFTASPVAEGTVVGWTTHSETENLGFHILRSLSEDGTYEPITKELISGAGSSRGMRQYRFVDRDVKPGTTYYYKIQDVDFAGQTQLHGPVKVRMEKPAIRKSTWAKIKAFLSMLLSPFNPGSA